MVSDVYIRMLEQLRGKPAAVEADLQHQPGIGLLTHQQQRKLLSVVLEKPRKNACESGRLVVIKEETEAVEMRRRNRKYIEACPPNVIEQIEAIVNNGSVSISGASK
ncbi:uncharacterized protein LOC119769971 [Culex quinquefasciatus]|uniref:uncharacterized protein LOC119769971 n=1 Tax=Culex quinquefasciatus TaxID=7176 RepID=UPI0018E3CA75|nr:uncharacterized protein LOC119769971 [Culex quinquefasciatus]